MKSFKKGAGSYVPKEEMANINVYLTDIREAKGKGEVVWWRWLKRFADYYDKKFGPDWREGDKEFWKKPEFWV